MDCYGAALDGLNRLRAEVLRERDAPEYGMDAWCAWLAGQVEAALAFIDGRAHSARGPSAAWSGVARRAQRELSLQIGDLVLARPRRNRA